MTTLNTEEQLLLNSVENEEWQTIDNFENSKAIYQDYAKKYLQQQTIEIVLSLEDQEKLLNLANNLGQSTSNLTKEILHKYLQGELIEKTA